ncbi:related to histone-lysine N-methyltransferase [Rhynchosporium agropyri]|uniref:Histone-lysine N-methyltransferase, H3 lysine-36 specific n=1 Tax=Rhynchosporium agropyri TaxID=914238 RepID=A0A1E1LEI7_9HELO|nr:related to histone-lysine N-methyltransferase [Rhynchosporium agropyri]
MADDTRNLPEAVDSALEEMKLQEGGSPVEDGDTIMVNGHHEDSSAPRNLQRSHSSSPAIKQSASQSPGRDRSASQTPRIQEEEEKETIGGGIVVTVEPGKAPKLSRKSSQKVISRPPPLYNDIADSTEEASEIFQVIKDCIYGSKHMGSSEHDALDCDCSEQWSNGTNQACGEDSDCINRATKMECVDGDCNCGSGCQNQRFQQKQYANVSVIKTDKKGYGLRANVKINADTFIFEYLGEVINEPTFRRRTQQYNDEGIKHFYFMSLTKHEFVDATKKGNLGRFCNHSCNPNCYVDKWVVGEKLRMGIFAERNIKAGEELVFNYNVDRYGADPQPCYCGEENCTGFIGGKTQTDRATKLPLATIEALGIDDGDGWDSAVTKRSRKKKTGEDDEEYVNNVQPKGLDEEGVRKVMATLMQCKEKWIAVKLLSRIQRCDDDRVRNRVVQMHGYQILRTTLTTWKDDNNVILQILDILCKFPRLTRNKISDSKIEATIETLVDSEHEDVAFEAKRLLEDWNKLEVAYRIPRKKFDPTAPPIFERRNTDREEVTKSPATPLVVAPKGPRSNLPQRNLNFASARPPFRRPPLSNVLPSGWFQAQDEKGNTYYYSKSGQTTWQRPNIPAYEPPPPPKAPPKSVQTARAIQDIIDSITKIDPKTPTLSIPTAESTPKEKKPVEKWRALSQEKQMKLYENTLFPHIKHVMQKFTKQLPREDLKKFAKEVGKKLVASDFKNNRVEDPTKISEKQEKKVKSYVRDFFEKAVQKRKAHDKKKAEKASLNGSASRAGAVINGVSTAEESLLVDDDLDPIVDFSPTALDAPPSSVPATPSISASGSTSDLKRKRDDEDGIEIDTPETGGTGAADESFSDTHKRLKEDEVTPPPPPPPPPVGGIPVDTLAGEDTGDENGIVIVNTVPESQEQLELRLQEEDLMRENEEAMALELAVTELESVKENLNGNGNLNGIGLGINLDADAIMESANEGPGKRSLS